MHCSQIKLTETNQLVVIWCNICSILAIYQALQINLCRYHPHFIDKKKEPKNSKLTYSTSQSWKMIMLHWLLYYSPTPTTSVALSWMKYRLDSFSGSMRDGSHPTLSFQADFPWYSYMTWLLNNTGLFFK